MEPVEPVQMNIYISNTDRIDLRHYYNQLRLRHFYNQPRVQGKQQVKDQQSCISVFVAYPFVAPEMTTVFHPRFYGRFIEI